MWHRVTLIVNKGGGQDAVYGTCQIRMKRHLLYAYEHVILDVISVVEVVVIINLYRASRPSLLIKSTDSMIYFLLGSAMCIVLLISECTRN